MSESKRPRRYSLTDFDALAADGIMRRAPWTRELIERRLAYLEACIEIGVVPDLRGERIVEAGRVSYETVEAPKALAAELRETISAERVAAIRAELDVTAAVEAVEARLSGGGLIVEAERLQARARAAVEAAGARLDGLNGIVANLERARGRKSLKGTQTGGKGKTRRGKPNKNLKPDTELILKLHDKGRNGVQIRDETEFSLDRIRSVIRRHRPPK